MAKKTNLQNIDKFFKNLQKEVVATAGIAASSYAKEASKTIMEEWAEILARNIELGFISPALSKSTEINRRSRGNKTYPPLFETGELAKHIEFRWTTVPFRNYDLLEVGIFDDSTLIGHTKSITPYKLGLMNEYGFSGTFTGDDGSTHTVNIPARPHFRESALDIGYELGRISRDVDSKTQVAFGREKRSIKNKGLSGRQLWDLSSTSPDRYAQSGSTSMSVGKFIVNSSGTLEFKWVSGDAANSG